MSEMTDAIAAHRAAWQAFQDAPDEINVKEFWRHADAECAAEQTLTSVIAGSVDDLTALKTYLDWWVVEESQRRTIAPALFAIHSAIKLAAINATLILAEPVIQKATALMAAVDFDNNGAMVGGQLMGGNGGLISRDTIKAADELRKALAVLP